MQKVLTFGTFDIFHPGHEFFLRKAKRCGDWLGVVVARDRNVKSAKGKLPRNNERIRLSVIKKLSYVDEVFFGNLKDRYSVIEKIVPNIICLGYDQQISAHQLKMILKKRGLNIKIIKFRKGYQTHLYKSSKM